MIAVIALLIPVAGLPLHAQNDGDGSLRALADKHDFYIGAAVQSRFIASEPRYAETLAREFNMLVGEYEMKMAVIQPAPGAFNFGPTDAMVEFAEANGMAVRGHTLIWHSATPSWVEKGDFTREKAIDILHDYITAVVSRYKGRIMAWDVVNEAIDGTGMRETVWYDLIGPEYIDLAFQWAHEADPDALLFYNDYNAEDMNAKSDAVYDLVKGMIERGVPIHGVGLQMHIRLGTFRESGGLSTASVAENIERLGALGLQVHITEMDVRTGGINTDAAFAEQAQIYYHALTVCLEAKACTALLTWGFTDQHTWIRVNLGEVNDRPLIFDEDYQPKPAYYGLRKALEGETIEAAALRTLAAAQGFYIGAAAQSGLIAGDAQYTEILAREFNMLALEHETKLSAVQPEPGVFDFDGADAAVEFAESHDMAVRGHRLVWHDAVPAWITAGDFTREEAIDILHDYVTAIVTRYKGRVAAWDVVSEAIDDDGALRQSIWYDLIGPEYIDLAFQWAHKADPDALLFYSDYGVDGINAKAEAVYESVKEWVERGVPIHGVSLEMRADLHTSTVALGPNIERLGALGLQAHVIEMDVTTPGGSAGVLKLQAGVYADVLKTCLEAGACTALLVRGGTDKYADLDDGDHPQIFDEHYRPQPAYYAMQEVLVKAMDWNE
ncbi:MAG: endo-1,4-beta-xylanase [Anaerolineae bacterium]|nr:endo-1,4-beta-xylanase [Anaerolineae bacterium]